MAESQQPQPQITKELSNLGKKLGDALRTVLNSPQRQEIEQEVREGFETIVDEINAALAKARSAEVAQDLGGQAEKLVSSVKSSKVTAEVRQGLLKGLQNLNKELDVVIERLQSPEAESAEETEPANVTENSG